LGPCSGITSLNFAFVVSFEGESISDMLWVVSYNKKWGACKENVGETAGFLKSYYIKSIHVPTS